MLSIQTNLASLLAQNNLRVNSDFQTKTIERVTSGFRINQSGDDAAGLSVANGYRSDVAELTQGVRNANDGVSMLQIVDGGLNNITKMLDRLKTLATESASDTFTGSRTILDNEFKDVLGEIDRQAAHINMNHTGIWAKDLQVYIGGGAAANNTVKIALAGSEVDTLATGLALAAATVGGADSSAAKTAIGLVDTALDKVGTVQGYVGSAQNKLSFAVNLASSQISSFSAAESRLRDADMASEAANLTKAQVLSQASLAAMAQANAAPQSVLSLLKG